MKRPKLTKNTTVEDFNDFYWLKEELIEFCRKEDLNKQGVKTEITERIVKYLKTGIKTCKKPKEIALQFEYNTYIRDFLKNNPERTRKEAIIFWKRKKALRGHNKYERADLNFFNESHS